jgi:hypothetical protein
MNPSRLTKLCLIPLLVLAPLHTAHADLDFEREPINYNEPTLADRVMQLQAALDSGEVTLEFDGRNGYLPAVLELLDIPQSSQMLVFSKTSLQLRCISPARPRAIYFNDDTYVGWVQHGEVIEVSTVDPRQGAIFYTLYQDQAEHPQFLRDRGQCLTCHASSRTEDVPGYLVRSVFADRRGQPQIGSGTFTTDDRSPFEERWGGWYVSGTHGTMRHMGNVISGQRSRPEDIDREAGANVVDLSGLLDVTPYLQPTSDVVALMVLEHQARVHNLITAANYEMRSALHYDGIMNEALDRPADYRSESTQRRIAAVGDDLLEGLLFVDEFPLTSPVTGVSDFAADFTSCGPRDGQGRSLRDLDLERRLFRYPCSYLVNSPSFDALPDPVRQYVTERLVKVLTGADQDEKFSHLTPEDRRNILDILRETKPGLFAAATTAG